jgi:hypothetical protein
MPFKESIREGLSLKKQDANGNILNQVVISQESNNATITTNNELTIQSNSLKTNQLKLSGNAPEITTGALNFTLPISSGTFITQSSTDTLSNKTLDSVVLENEVTGSAILDEDDMATAGDKKLATQRSIKAYVDSVASGLDIKKSVRVSTTTSGTLSTSFASGQTIDGITLSSENRILIKDQTDASENGIYTVNPSGAPTRSSDANNSEDVTAGMFMFVEEGAINGDKGFVLTTNDTITLGTTNLSFTQFSGTGQITAGTGLTKTGNALNVDASQTHVTAVGTLTSGTWQADPIAVAHGGTGLTAYTAGDLIYSDGPNSLAKLEIGTTGNVLKVSSGGEPEWATFSGSGSEWILDATNDLLYPNSTTTKVQIGTTTTGNTFNLFNAGTTHSIGNITTDGTFTTNGGGGDIIATFGDLHAKGSSGKLIVGQSSKTSAGEKSYTALINGDTYLNDITYIDANNEQGLRFIRTGFSGISWYGDETSATIGSENGRGGYIQCDCGDGFGDMYINAQKELQLSSSQKCSFFTNEQFDFSLRRNGTDTPLGVRIQDNGNRGTTGSNKATDGMYNYLEYFCCNMESHWVDSESPDRTIGFSSYLGSQSNAYSNVSFPCLSTEYKNLYITVQNASQVSGERTGGYYSAYFNSSGLGHLSDGRMKTDVETIPNPLEIIRQLRGVYFKWNDGRSEERQTGFIAQEVDAVFTEIVDYDTETDAYSVSYDKITGLLNEGIKAVDKENTELKEKVSTLETELNTYKAIVDKLVNATSFDDFKASLA